MSDIHHPATSTVSFIDLPALGHQPPMRSSSLPPKGPRNMPIVGNVCVGKSSLVNPVSGENVALTSSEIRNYSLPSYIHNPATTVSSTDQLVPDNGNLPLATFGASPTPKELHDVPIVEGVGVLGQSSLVNLISDKDLTSSGTRNYPLHSYIHHPSPTTSFTDLSVPGCLLPTRSSSPAPKWPRNITSIFGDVGVGKSSLVNPISSEDVALLLSGIRNYSPPYIHNPATTVSSTHLSVPSNLLPAMLSVSPTPKELRSVSTIEGAGIGKSSLVNPISDEDLAHTLSGTRNDSPQSYVHHLATTASSIDLFVPGNGNLSPAMCSSSSTPKEPRSISIVGDVGVGKSSLINPTSNEDLALTSNRTRSDSLQSYPTTILPSIDLSGNGNPPPAMCSSSSTPEELRTISITPDVGIGKSSLVNPISDEGIALTSSEVRSYSLPSYIHNPATTVSSIDTVVCSPSPTPKWPRNVLIVGDVGVGKSSLVNLISDRDVAPTSRGTKNCTLQSREHKATLSGIEFALHDTAGLHAARDTMNKDEYLDAINQGFALISRLERAGGINLLVYCMKAGRIGVTTQQTYNLFAEVFCNHQVPVIIAVTHLEDYSCMEEWWGENEKDIKEYGFRFHGHACITTTRGYKNIYNAKYEESREVIRKILLECSTQVAWKEDKAAWVRRMVLHLRCWLPPRLAKKLDGSFLRKKLIKRCGLSAEDAESVIKNMEVQRADLSR